MSFTRQACTIIASLVAAAVASASCNQSQGKGLSPVGPSVASALSLDAKGKSIGPVSLRVAVSNTDAFGNAAGITNDGLGDYIDGSQNVQAQLDSSGTFAFNTFNSTHGNAARWVNYDFSHPTDPSNTFGPPQDHAQNYHFSTGASAFSPWVPLQFLGTPGYPAIECGYMGNGFSANSSTGYRVSYHKGFEDTQSSPTAFAVFTRTSVNPSVWTVQPAGSCSPTANVAALRSSDGTILYGYYTIPFLFTLTAR